MIFLIQKCLQGCAIAYHNQKLPLNLLCSWLLVIQEDLVAIINESPGLEIKIGDSGDALVQFNKKEFNLENIPEDLLSTPASGTLSQHVLYDMCQGNAESKIKGTIVSSLSTQIYDS